MVLGFCWLCWLSRYICRVFFIFCWLCFFVELLGSIMAAIVPVDAFSVWLFVLFICFCISDHLLLSRLNQFLFFSLSSYIGFFFSILIRKVRLKWDTDLHFLLFWLDCIQSLSIKCSLNKHVKLCYILSFVCGKLLQLVVHSSLVIMFQGEKLDRCMSSWDSVIWRCPCIIELGTKSFQISLLFMTLLLKKKL